MINRESRKWFWLGFGVTAIIALAFLAVTQAPLGRAQEDRAEEVVDNQAVLEAMADGSETLTGEAARIAEAEAAAQYGSPLVIPAAEFTSDGNFPGGFRFVLLERVNGVDRGGFLRGTLQESTCLQAPVYLPQGAIMTDMITTVVDNDTINQIVVTLFRSRKTTGATTTLAIASTSRSGSSSSVQNIAAPQVTGPTVNNDEYAYYVTTCLPAATIQLFSVRIYYDAP